MALTTYMENHDYKCPCCGEATNHYAADGKRHITRFKVICGSFFRRGKISCLGCGLPFDKGTWNVPGPVGRTECALC